MRKRARVAAVAALMAALAGPLPAAVAAAAAPVPAVSARAAALYDPAAHELLWSYRPDLQLPVASLTKLMTAYLALQAPPSTPVRVGADAVAMPETKAGLVAGHTYTLGSLLPLLIVRSANDVAVAVADGLGGGVAAFAADMNAEAAAMGLRDTHYVNPSGLDAPGQHSSARDVAVLAGLDMSLPAFRQLAALRTATLPGGGTFRDENPFLGAYPGADGVKTGFTSAAGFCLAASATRGGRRLLAVVLDEPSWAQAVADASALLDWGFAQPAPDGAHGNAAAVTVPLAPAAGAGWGTPPPAPPRAAAIPDGAQAPREAGVAPPARPAPQPAAATGTPRPRSDPASGSPPRVGTIPPSLRLGLAAVALLGLGALAARRRGSSSPGG
jgi:D-alanyl-D-alanine carboxypeptidase